MTTNMHIYTECRVFILRKSFGTMSLEVLSAKPSAHCARLWFLLHWANELISPWARLVMFSKDFRNYGVSSLSLSYYRHLNVDCGMV